MCKMEVLEAQLHDMNWFMGYVGGNDPYNAKPDDAFGLFRLSFSSGHFDYSEKNNFRNAFLHNNAAFSDAAGNVAATFNGLWLTDRAFKTMKNGDSLYYTTEPKMYGYSDDALIQGGLFLPWPGHPDSVFLFYSSNANVGGATGGVVFASRHLQYALIRLSGNDGLGEVIQQRNVLIEDTIQYGMLTAARHANGRDWWMLINERNSNRFYRLLVDPDGVHLLGQQKVTEVVKYGAGGQAVFSPDGKYYAMFHGIDQAQGSYLYVYNFDRCQGVLSEQRIVHFSIGTFSGLAFSPNSRFLYQTPLKVAYQYDLEAPDLEASRVTVGEVDTTFFNPLLVTFNQMQLAPDGKIYISGSGSVKNLNVIHAPDEPGLTCLLEPHGITLPVHNFASVTSFPHYRLGPLDGSLCDTLGLHNRPVAWFRSQSDTLDILHVAFLDLSYYEPTDWDWDFGDGKTSFERHPKHHYESVGVYNVCLTVTNANSSSTFCRKLYLGVTSGTLEPDNLHGFSVLPNPTDAQIQVLLSEPAEAEGRLSIFDVSGHLAGQWTIPAGMQQLWLDLTNLPAGMYWVQWRNERGAAARRVVKR